MQKPHKKVVEFLKDNVDRCANLSILRRVVRDETTAYLRKFVPDYIVEIIVGGITIISLLLIYL